LYKIIDKLTIKSMKGKNGLLEKLLYFALESMSKRYPIILY